MISSRRRVAAPLTLSRDSRSAATSSRLTLPARSARQVVQPLAAELGERAAGELLLQLAHVEVDLEPAKSQAPEGEVRLVDGEPLAGILDPDEPMFPPHQDEPEVAAPEIPRSTEGLGDVLVDVVREERSAHSKMPLDIEETGPGLPLVLVPVVPRGELIGLVHRQRGDPAGRQRVGPHSLQELAHTPDGEQPRRSRGAGDGLPQERCVGVDVPARTVRQGELDQAAESVGLPLPLGSDEDRHLAGVEAQVPGPMADRGLQPAAGGIVLSRELPDPAGIPARSRAGLVEADPLVLPIEEDRPGEVELPALGQTPFTSLSWR